MNIEVNNDIINQTTNCTKQHACINHADYDFCKVENCINNKIHFIKCKSQSSCSYKISFGDSFVCSCPIRKEIYNRYNI